MCQKHHRCHQCHLCLQRFPQSVAGRQHCRDTLLHNTENTVKLHLSIQRATPAGALGSEDYAEAGNSGRAEKNLCKDFNKISTTCIA